jgi:phosphomannomutase
MVMSSQAKFSISGLRGVWGESLNEEISTSHIKAFAVYLQKMGAKKVIIARDTRISGPAINNIARAILVNAGFEVMDAGIIPTPTIIFLIRNTPFDAGIMITASHNPPEYNGIKFLTRKAMYINSHELEEIKGYIGSTPITRDGGSVIEDFNLGEKHVEYVIQNIDKDLITSKKFKVVIDTINGAGCVLGPMLLERFGCEVTVINGEPNGHFAHIPEPLPENLKGLGEKVKEVSADIGFAQDPDADRLVMCDELGEVIFEEYMLSVTIKSVLEKTPGDIVTNLSTSNTTEDIVNSLGYKNYRTKVGEGNVVDGIIKQNAVIGGEGSGGCIYPKINLCRDSLTGMALILQYLATTNKTISQIIDELPKYEFIKTKMPFSGNLTETLNKVIASFPDGKADLQDGLRIDFPDRSWVQIRESNTEPIVRIWSEAKTKERALELVDIVKSKI